MKKSILALVAMTSLTAFACPDLTGDYLCVDPQSGDKAEILLRQSVVDGITYFYDERAPEGAFAADGQDIQLPDNDQQVNAVQNTSCVGNNLKMTLKFDAVDRGVEFAHVDMTRNIYLDGNKNLEMATNILISPKQGNQRTQTDVQNCTRM